MIRIGKANVVDGWVGGNKILEGWLGKRMFYSTEKPKNLVSRIFAKRGETANRVDVHDALSGTRITSSTTGASSQHVSDMFSDNDGNVYIAQLGGLSKFNFNGVRQWQNNRSGGAVFDKGRDILYSLDSSLFTINKDTGNVIKTQAKTPPLVPGYNGFMVNSSAIWEHNGDIYSFDNTSPIVARFDSPDASSYTYHANITSHNMQVRDVGIGETLSIEGSNKLIWRNTDRTVLQTILNVKSYAIFNDYTYAQHPTTRVITRYSNMYHEGLLRPVVQLEGVISADLMDVDDKYIYLYRKHPSTIAVYEVVKDSLVFVKQYNMVAYSIVGTNDVFCIARGEVIE